MSMLEHQSHYEEDTSYQPKPARQEPDPSFAEQCRRRMLAWPNPVEYVNDMYGCHPGKGDTEYFRTVFGK
jgi:hypothetical protein